MKIINDFILEEFYAPLTKILNKLQYFFNDIKNICKQYANKK